MIRLNLLLADMDAHYLMQLANYFQNHHGASFNVNYVTSEAHLKTYLGRHRDSTDLMMISPGLAKALYTGLQTTVILLSDGRLENAETEYPVLDKFQRGDQMASKALQIYMEQHPNRRFINTSSGSSRLIGVFSPSGGCGKSAVAAGLSATAHHRGKKAMYLNLEGCESTEAWFPEGNCPSISELFYHLKEGASQLSMKLEALSYRDPVSRVRTFMPADTLLDFNELTESDLEILTDELRKTGDLDVVFVDLAASVDAKNLKLMELMDQVLLVVADDGPSQAKVRQFMAQIPTLERKRNVDFSGKTTLVCNGRYGLGYGAFDAGALKGICTLPKDPALRQGRSISDKLGGAFGRQLAEVWHILDMG